METSFSVSSREWVIAFWVLIGIAIVAMLGLTARAALAVLIVIVLTLLANRACSHPKLTYFNGLRVVASINPTGEVIVGQVFVLPALAMATIFSWFLGLIWLFGGREWPIRQWLRFLRRYEGLARRLSYRD